MASSRCLRAFLATVLVAALVLLVGVDETSAATTALDWKVPPTLRVTLALFPQLACFHASLPTMSVSWSLVRSCDHSCALGQLPAGHSPCGSYLHTIKFVPQVYRSVACCTACLASHQTTLVDSLSVNREPWAISQLASWPLRHDARQVRR